MLLEITHVTDQHDTRFVVIQPGRSYVLGKDILFADSTVSSPHARLTLDGERIVVEDMRSHTGTFVDDERIDGPTEIAILQPVRIGETIVRVVHGDRPPAPNLEERRPRTATEDELIATLRANPADDGARIVYADWLEAEGHRITARYIRLELAGPIEIEHSEEANRAVGITTPEWRALVSRAPIHHCARRACPRSWHLLAAGGPTERTCGTCGDRVHYYITNNDIERRLEARAKIVFDVAQSRRRIDGY